ncbi:MAG: LamG domain-containing protein, partial [Verrucomicrobia bacterium]|nr:LamG domain-containing protein [Verrucomicrobiota bacterium]
MSPALERLMMDCSFMRKQTIMKSPTSVFHTSRSRRRKEAERSRPGTRPPPHVGGYGLSAFRTGCEVWGPSLSWLVVCAVTASLAFAGPPDGPFAPDEHTLLLAHFDKSANTDHSLGLGLADGGGTLTKEGRFGGGIVLGRRSTLTFSGKGNFPGNEGTVEFWIRPGWGGDDGRTRSVLSAAAHERNQISINKLANGRFGIGMFGMPAGAREFVYRRVNQDISAWKAGEWHHVAVCWGGGELALWLDGQKAESKTGAVPPQGTPNGIRFQGDDYVLDELCISRIARYTDRGRIAGKPVAPRVQLGYDWKFNEPAGVYR